MLGMLRLVFERNEFKHNKHYLYWSDQPEDPNREQLTPDEGKFCNQLNLIVSCLHCKIQFEK